MKKKLIYTFLTFGLTALIGVGAFVGLQNKPIKETMAIEAPRKYAKISPSQTTPLESAKTYYFVAKDYQNNGLGTFYYQEPINIDNSAYAGHSPGNPVLYIGDFDIIDHNTLIKSAMVYRFELSAGTYRISDVSLVDSEGHNRVYIYRASSGTFNRSNAAFLMTNFERAYEQGNDSYDVYPMLNQFFNIYEMGDNFYTFSEQINYYAPYNQDVSSYYVNDSTMNDASSFSVKTILENTNFYSGGYAFDTIRLRYQNAISTSYIDSNGSRQVWNVNGFASFMYMEYVNSVTNLIVVVNERIYEPWNSGNSSGYNQTKSSKWVSKNFTKIQFFDDVSEVTLTEISKLNNSSYSGGYTATNNDIGMGSAFTLIGQAFTAWLPILSVSVIPGITLGTLIFLPLIAGIIILIIWIVKR